MLNEIVKNRTYILNSTRKKSSKFVSNSINYAIYNISKFDENARFLYKVASKIMAFTKYSLYTQLVN